MNQLESKRQTVGPGHARRKTFRCHVHVLNAIRRIAVPKMVRVIMVAGRRANTMLLVLKVLATLLELVHIIAMTVPTA